MKKIAVTWEETTVYEAVIEVPDDYPESAEAYVERQDADVLAGADGEDDWFDKVEAQEPDWFKNGCMEVRDRELTNIERVKEAAER